MLTTVAMNTIEASVGVHLLSALRVTEEIAMFSGFFSKTPPPSPSLTLTRLHANALRTPLH